ncbi:hypothetical protein K469DRAFT_750856 [Zopfia rhizophila CBS 207.26]|uniref:Clr5 domain-containing protein n=1 Tax=Zopfia rhizophila CBS 207.26 TaxID=1314779 RepID=A0A6A6E489_9PEZI|nr:hypothetical protein K469DRAFT_750856 [Zopfia rhizophila CBS 207.26]
MMLDNEPAGENSNVPAPFLEPPVASSKRSKYRNLDWEGNRKRLHQLYPLDSKSLTETMQIMKNEYGFDASLKLGDGRSTCRVPWLIRWSKRVTQGRRVERRQNSLAHTPAGMVVATPGSSLDNQSPTVATSPQNVEDAGSPDVIVLRSNPLPGKKVLPLSWNDQNRQDLAATLEMAQSDYEAGELDQAESAFIEAYEGYEHLLSSTHDETVKVAYRIATFYTHFCDSRMGHCGVAWTKIKSTKWHREEAEEVKAPQRSIWLSGYVWARTTPGICEDVNMNANSSRIDYGLSVARVHVATGEPAVETFLKTIEHLCTRDPRNLAIQGLRARGELLKLYLKQDASDTIIGHGEAFSTASAVFSTFWDQFSWNRKNLKSRDILEAAMELASCALKGGFDNNAKWMFRRIENKATSVLGSDDERTIWTLISIGIVYQNAKWWYDAKPWFEQACAAADAKYGTEDGITESLELALEKRHFSYISDEGRPFKLSLELWFHNLSEQIAPGVIFFRHGMASL